MNVVLEEVSAPDFYSEANAKIFDATLALERTEITGASLARVLLTYPWMTARIMVAIHWQALKLWWKGAGYRARPEPPAEEVTR